jgi:dihydroorotase
MTILIKNGTIINEGLSYTGSLLIKGNLIEKIYKGALSEETNEFSGEETEIVDASGMFVIPGVIDDQVHFREPGAEYKACIESESKAAILGGVTSYMDMPNNNPPATDIITLEKKFKRASEVSYANYSFYFGATDTNINEIKMVDTNKVCGIKVFMGSSTGNMLVQNPEALNKIFAESPALIATHCEEESIIQENTKRAVQQFGAEIPFETHPLIRSREACIKSSGKAIKLALKYCSRLHILHISTADEIEMLKAAQKKNKKISGEVCVHYMWFSDKDYHQYGGFIKCNPSIKSETDREAIIRGVKEGVVKVVATDHAPHLKEEKMRPYLRCPSGMPEVRHSLQMMLELSSQGIFTKEEVVARMCHGPAECFGVEKRGYLREGYYADIAVVNPNEKDFISTANPPYKCGWSPLNGTTFSCSIVHTFVNGVQAVKNGELIKRPDVMPLSFKRKANTEIK